ncbi:MAG: redoxin domain-containing protein [Proteobacteria bacterium]|nr:redoxin domain-containing protein [Pseudomonadota bacterium]
MRTTSRVLTAGLAITTAFLFLTYPNSARTDATVKVKTSLSPDVVFNGEHVTLAIEIKIPSGYHLYSMTKIADGPRPLTIDLEHPNLEPIGSWHAPKPKVEFDSNFKKSIEYYSDAVVHSLAFKVIGDRTDPIETLTQVKGQICSRKKCIPFRKKIKILLTVNQGDARAEYASRPKLNGEAFSPDRPPPAGLHTKRQGLPTDQGLLGFLLIAFIAGLGALVTPCVFPMIPITISFFSKFSKVSIRRSVSMATIYAGSIISCFTLIGIAVSVIFGAVGMQALSASVAFNIFLALLLLVFAFNLWGLFEIQIPSWLISKTSEKEMALTSDDGSLAKQSLGVFFMAITFTLVSFTCTVGFIGVVLAEAAKGNWFYPAIGMLSFSLAFSLPFFFLAIFPTWADKLQGKGGDWMVAVKVVLGFLEFAGAFKFLSNVDLVREWGFITRPFVLSIWVAVFLAAGLFLLRVFNLPHSDTEEKTVGPIRMFFAMCMLALAAYSAASIRSSKSMGGWLDGWLPPSLYPGQEAEGTSDIEGSHMPWIIDDIDKGMAKARQENQPLFIDFTGYTCTNCRYMEESVFPKPKVSSRLKKMVLVTAYTDGVKDVHDKQRELQIKRFSTAALPFYAIINPHDDSVIATFPSMTNDVDEFVAFLDNALAAFNRVKPKQAEETDKKKVSDAGMDKTDSGQSEKISLDLAASGKKVDFEFPSLLGKKKTKLSSLRGGWVFVNFWASWCAPCKKELKEDFPPALEKAPQIKLVTVAFDGDDTKDAAIRVAKEINLFKHIVLQGGEDITEAGLEKEFDISESLPISYLIHPNGHIAWKHKGSVTKELLINLFLKTKP